MAEHSPIKMIKDYLFKPRHNYIALDGEVLEARDNNPRAILGDLPGINRNQAITIKLVDNFWPIMHVKKVKLLIDKKEIPEAFTNSGRRSEK